MQRHQAESSEDDETINSSTMKSTFCARYLINVAITIASIVGPSKFRSISRMYTRAVTYLTCPTMMVVSLHTAGYSQLFISVGMDIYY